MDPIRKTSPLTPRQGVLNTASGFGKTLNANADSALNSFANIGEASNKILKNLDNLFSTTGLIDSSANFEKTVKQATIGAKEGFLSQVARTGATLLNATTGILSLAQATNIDRRAGDTSYSRTITAVCKSVGQMSVGMLAGVGVAALAPTTIPALAVTIGGGLIVTGVSILAGKAFDYISQL